MNPPRKPRSQSANSVWYRDRKNQVIIALGAIVVGGLVAWLVTSMGDEKLPTSIEKDLAAAQRAAKYNQELDAIAARLATETDPAAIRDGGIEVSEIEQKAINDLDQLPAGKNPNLDDRSRNEVRKSLKFIRRAAIALKEAEEALRLGAEKITEAKKAAASQEISSDLTSQAAISSKGAARAKVAAGYLAKSRAAIERARVAIKQIANVKQIESEELRDALARLGLAVVPSQRDVRKLVKRLEEQEARLEEFAASLTPEPAVIDCGNDTIATSPVSTFNPDADPCKAARVIAYTYYRGIFPTQRSFNVASLGNYSCRPTGEVIPPQVEGGEGAGYFRCVSTDDPSVYVEYPIGG